jgi:hypothetical protein
MSMIGDDMLLYRHNEGKVKQWLAKKVRRGRRRSYTLYVYMSIWL